MFLSIPIFVGIIILVYSLGAWSKDDQIDELNQKIKSLEEENRSWIELYEEIKEEVE